MAKLLSKKNKDKTSEYKDGLKKLKCLGNFLHNIETLNNGGADIVVVKRPSKARKVSDYFPCIHCYGFYVGDELWKHTKNCAEQTGENCASLGDVVEKTERLLTESNILLQSKLLLECACLPECDSLSMSDSLQVLVNSMHQDNLAKVVSKDNMLLLFGES